MNGTKSLKVVDLFAGCGGLSLGLEQAGFVPVFVNELNDHARETYVRNRKDKHPWFDSALRTDRAFECSDVKNMVLDKKFLPKLEKNLKSEFGIHHEELDLLVGGPPCQGFSGIGHRRSYSVDKEQLPSNHLFQDMAAIIHRLRPRAFLFENVRGLMNAKWNGSGEPGEILDEVYETFDSIPGYSVAYQLVYARDYGVPQNRPRILMVGIRDREKVDPELRDQAVKLKFLPESSGVAPDLIDLLGDLIDEEYENGGSTTQYTKPARTKLQRYFRPDATKTGDGVSEHDYSKHNPKILAKFEAMQDPRSKERGKIPAEFQTKKFAQRLLPERWGKIGPTITATSLPDDYVHFAQPRTLTVREWARLQMFPDWYQFSGKRTTGGLRRAGNPREGIFDREVPKYTQIGNAVPVGLARAVGDHLAKILKR